MTMRPLFIGGCGRSGTTMLGDLLGAPPAHVCLPEASYKLAFMRNWGWRQAHRDASAALSWLQHQRKFRELGIDLGPGPEVAELGFRDLFQRIAEAYAAAVGRRDAVVWIDHSPQNAQLGRILFEEWPAARLVHLVRDGRAIAASVLPLDWGPNNPVSAAQWWTKALAHGLALESTFPGRVLRVSYEELAREPEPVLRRICDFASLGFDPSMLRGGGLRVSAATAGQHSLVGKPPDPARIDAWRRTLTSRQIELFEAEAGQLLPLLGYVPVYGEAARGPSAVATLMLEATNRVRNLTINRLRKRRRRSPRA
jgi:hypothetical protein